MPRFIPFAAACLVSAASLSAQPTPTMGVHDIKPGMKGYGKTVFQGGKIERFEFEVLGVQLNSSPGRNIIWVKAKGGYLGEVGVPQGMSGSPCYIDGKLIGAVALGEAFQKEPVAGVTPIGEMLEQLKDMPEATGFRTPLVLPKIEPPKVLKSALNGKMIPLAEVLGDQGSAPLDLVGGELSEEARGFWSGVPVRFQPLMASAGGGGGEASPIEPGGMAAISMMQGDMMLGGFGTITYVDQKKILLFGHPMFNLGAVDMPMWSATVSGVMSSFQVSHKMAQPVAPIGALRADRSAGVAGVLGAEAKLVPLRLGLNLGGKKTLNFRFDMIDHPIVTPFLAATAVSQALTTHVRGLGLQSLSLQGNIKVTGHPPILIENVTADLSSARIAGFVGAMLQALEFNPFERPQIEGISLTIKAEERLDLTAIAGARLLKARAKRGEPLPVVVTLQNIQGVRETATFNLNIPSSAQPGKATLLVGDGLSLSATDPDERAIETASLGDVVRVLNGALRNNHVYALIVQQQPGAGLRGLRIEGIPPTISAQLMSDGIASDNRLQRRIISRGMLPLEREVKGLVALELDIE